MCVCVCVCVCIAERSVQTSALPAINSLCCYHGHHQWRNINEQKEERASGGERQTDVEREVKMRWGTGGASA